jgi:hypothetical protein
MQKLAFISLLGLALGITAADLVASRKASAQATAVTTNETIPITISVFIPCVPELVTASGDLHIVTHTTLNPDGGFHVMSHFNPQGVSGTGDVTGNKYQGTGVTMNEFNAVVGSQFTFVNNFRFIGQGPGNNSMVHQNVHVTVNANGEVTSTVDNFSATCK